VADEVGGGVLMNPEARLPHAALKPEARFQVCIR
jgi:hypothetical protein